MDRHSIAPRRSATRTGAILGLLALLLAFAGTAGAQTTRLRLMAANISSGNNQSYDPGHGTRIFQGLDPDIVMIQEFNYGGNTASEIRGWVDTAFGTNYQYYREGGAQIPNGVISKYPIIASGEWDDTSVSNRDFAWARIDIPGDKHLWAISVHLLTTSSSVRNTEATALRNYIQANVPAGDFIAIGGDFNTGSFTEACFSTFSSVVKTSSPYPADQAGKTGTNASRAKPYDHVLVSTSLNAYQTPVVIGSNSHANGLVFDSRVYSPLSAVSPVQSADSGATNMQHMAVVKDFLIPSGGSSTPTPTATATPTPTATATATPSPTPSGNVLTSGQAVSGSVTSGAWVHYTINVPSNATQLAIVMTGTGDADLYVRRGSAPTTSAYDFRPYLGGSAENVTVSSSSSPALVPGSTYYISVNGYASSSTYNLTATITTGTSPTPTPTPTATATATPTPTPTPSPTSTGGTMTSGVPVSGSVSQGQWKNNSIFVPSGKTSLSIVMTGSGDPDLYVRRTSLPTLSVYDFRPYLTGASESVTVNGSSSPALVPNSLYYISVYGYTAGSYNITATVN